MPTIKLQARDVDGRPYLTPRNEPARLLAKLIGLASIPSRVLPIVRALGFKIEVRS